MRLFASLLLAASIVRAADVPPVLHQEGRILRADGTPERGSMQLVFAIYDVATGGSAVWSETQSVSLSTDGYYAAILGNGIPLPALNGSAYWLGITVVGEAEMLPRARVASVPFSLRAGNSERLAGVAASEFLQVTSTIDATKVALPGGSTPLITSGRLTDALLSPRVPLLDTTTNLLPVSVIPAAATGASISDTASDLPVGGCMTIAHNLDTYAVRWQAWMTDMGAWVPMAAESRDGLVNLALNKTSGASSAYSGAYASPYVNDGLGGCSRWLPCSGCNSGWVQVDLGSITMINKVRVLSGCSDTATAWNVQVSQDGTGFTQQVAQGSCVINGSCNSFIDHVFTPVAARWVRILTTNGTSTYWGIGEMEVYGATYPVTLLDTNRIRLCNHTGLTRSFILIVGR